MADTAIDSRHISVWQYENIFNHQKRWETIRFPSCSNILPYRTYFRQLDALCSELILINGHVGRTFTTNNRRRMNGLKLLAFPELLHLPVTHEDAEL